MLFSVHEDSNSLSLKIWIRCQRIRSAWYLPFVGSTRSHITAAFMNAKQGDGHLLENTAQAKTWNTEKLIQ